MPNKFYSKILVTNFVIKKLKYFGKMGLARECSKSR